MTIEYDECGVETQDSWARRKIAKRESIFWDLRAVFNTIQMYHPTCSCPTHEELVNGDDGAICEFCICEMGLKDLNELEKT